MKRFSTAVEVTSRPNCAAVDWKSVALASGFLSRVRTSIRNKLTAVNFRRRWITPVARPSSSVSGPRTYCIVAATLPTISIGKLLLRLGSSPGNTCPMGWDFLNCLFPPCWGDLSPQAPFHGGNRHAALSQKTQNLRRLGKASSSADFSTPTGERPSRARRGSPR